MVSVSEGGTSGTHADNNSALEPVELTAVQPPPLEPGEPPYEGPTWNSTATPTSTMPVESWRGWHWSFPRVSVLRAGLYVLGTLAAVFAVLVGCLYTYYYVQLRLTSTTATAGEPNSVVFDFTRSDLQNVVVEFDPVLAQSGLSLRGERIGSFYPHPYDATHEMKPYEYVAENDAKANLFALGVGGSSGKFTTTALASGYVLWSFQHPLLQGTPAVGWWQGSSVYLGSLASNSVHALTPSGALRWSYLTGGSVEASPTLGVDGTLYVGSWDQCLYALTPEGTLRWRFRSEGRISQAAALSLDGLAVYFVASDASSNPPTRAYAVRASDGALLWNYTVESSGTVSAPVVARDGCIYISTQADGVLALYPNGVLRWQVKGGSLVAPALTPASALLLVTPAGAQALHAYNGTTRWIFNFSSTLAAAAPQVPAPVVSAADGTTYVAQNLPSGTAVIFALHADGTIKWQLGVSSGSISAAPAAGVDGTLYFVAAKSYLLEVTPAGVMRRSTPLAPSHCADIRGLAVGASGVVYVNCGNELLAVSTKVFTAVPPWPQLGQNSQLTSTQPMVPLSTLLVKYDFRRLLLEGMPNVTLHLSVSKPLPESGTGIRYHRIRVATVEGVMSQGVLLASLACLGVCVGVLLINVLGVVGYGLVKVWVLAGGPLYQRVNL